MGTLLRLAAFIVGGVVWCVCLVVGAAVTVRDLVRMPRPVPAERFEICTVSLASGHITNIPGDPAFAETDILIPGADS